MLNTGVFIHVHLQSVRVYKHYYDSMFGAGVLLKKCKAIRM